MQTGAAVIIPQPAGARQIGVDTVHQDQGTWPCLWLLHGLSDDHTGWTRRTAIERYAEAAGIAVVMPDVHRSFYTNMVHGGAYGDFLHEELPRLIRSFFPLSAAKRDNAVAGLSMGGYGAFKWALSCPESFQAAASLSGVMDISARFQQLRTQEPDSLRRETLTLVFGDRDPGGGPDDLFPLAQSLGGKAPPLLQICGTEDFLYPENLRFRDHARNCGVPLEYREGPGDHEWGFWDREIQTVLAWLPEQGFGTGNSLS
ncbi:MAG: esterase family protein [Verrucomicrobia bacterium]|nr:esterase family protein [Verrucomicrobiota bacterium]